MSKTDWKPEDLRGSGHYLVRTEKDHIERTGFLTTIMNKVSYQIAPNRRYGLTAMSDGWSCYGKIENGKYIPFETLQDLCDHLNSAKEGQRMRPATKEEVLRVINYSSKRCFES